MNINNDHWKTLWIDVETHQSSEYVPLSCAAQNLSLCWKRTISISIQQFRGKNKTLGTMHCIVMEDISIGYYPTFMKYNQKKGETKQQMTAIIFWKRTICFMNWIKWFCISLLPTRVLLRIQEAPLPTCRSNVAICISRTQARFVSTLYQLAVYLLGLGVLYQHCIGTHNVSGQVRKSVLSANKSRLIVWLSVFEGLGRMH